MQRNVGVGQALAASVSFVMAVCVTSSCAGAADSSPAVGSAEVELSRPRVPLGSPMEVTYRFRVASDAPALGERWVFAHFVDANEELMWTDDHEPPTPTSAWRPGETIEYTRTVFAPIYQYVGRAKIIVGLYDRSTNERLRLSQPDRGDQSYQVAELELLPQTENVFVIFKDGWYAAEFAPDNPIIEWQWTRQDATLAFRNPKRDATLFLQVDNPAAPAHGARQVDVRVGDTLLETVPVSANEAPVRRIALAADQLGTGDLAEIRLSVDSTFVPALVPGAKSNDTRELGVRVFHAFVQPH